MADEPAAPAAPGTPATPPAAPAVPPADPAAPPAALASDSKPWWDGKVTEPEIVEFAKAKNYASGEEALRAAWSANKMMKMEPAVQAYLEGKATPEQEAAVLNKLRPETADGYTFKHPEGTVVDANLEKLGKNIFHTLGVPQAKAQVAMDMWNKAMSEQAAANIEADRIANDKAVEDLKKSYGENLNAMQAAGERVVKALGLDDAYLIKIEENIGGAAMIELFAKIGMKSAEGSFKSDANPPGNPDDPNLMSAEQANAKMTSLRSDTEFMKKYETREDPGHAEAVKLMEQLAAKAYTKPK